MAGAGKLAGLARKAAGTGRVTITVVASTDGDLGPALVADPIGRRSEPPPERRRGRCGGGTGPPRSAATGPRPARRVGYVLGGGGLEVSMVDRLAKLQEARGKSVAKRILDACCVVCE